MARPTPEAFLARAAAAAGALREVMGPTPLQRNALLSERHGAEVLLKREDLSPVRSYKLRGAFNVLRHALGARPGERRFACASAGNHAQGFAFACRHFGVDGVVFMPVTTPRQKIAKCAMFGAERVEIRLEGDFFDPCYAAARAFAEASGAVMVPPFDHPHIVEGQASVGLEILDQAPGPVDLLILPVGGGGLAAGVCEVMRARSPATEIAFVEPAGAPSLRRSLEEGRRVRLDRVDGFVDGAAVAEIGALNFEMLRDRRPEDVLAIDEDRLCETILEMLDVEGMVLEPAGALEIDALRWLDPARLRGRRVVCVTSGGNFDFDRLPEVKERALKASGRKKYFILRLPQRPGALRDFLEVLGPEDDIARFEYLKRSSRSFGSILLGIETTDPANFERLAAAMEAAGFRFRDITDDEVVAGLLV